MAFYENRTIVLALRVIQAIFAIIVLGTAAYVAHWWNSYWNASSPSENNFLIFCAVWSLLALVYLIIVPMMFVDSVLHHKFAILAIEAITMLFWFAGFIALAVWLPDGACGANNACATARAACVFGAFSWVVWAVTTAMAVMRVMHTRGMSSSKGDPNLRVQEGV